MTSFTPAILALSIWQTPWKYEAKLNKIQCVLKAKQFYHGSTHEELFEHDPVLTYLPCRNLNTYLLFKFILFTQVQYKLFLIFFKWLSFTVRFELVSYVLVT